MWDDLRERIDVEREQIRRLIDAHRTEIDRAQIEPPSYVEQTSLAAFLHAFYNGIEGVFRQIARQIDGGEPTGEAWHQQLLISMSQSTSERGNVITLDLRERLRVYLGFRHVFWQAYTFQIEWDRMEPLVTHCEETFEELGQQLDRFIAKSADDDN